MRVLVVDDVPVVRLVIGKALRRAGHEVLEAGEGGEALRILRSQTVDVLVTDIWMPGMDGLGLIRSAAEAFPGLGIVAMSGGDPQASMADSLAEAAAAGAPVSVMKPIDKDELLAAVDAAAGRRGRCGI